MELCEQSAEVGHVLETLGGGGVLCVPPPACEDALLGRAGCRARGGGGQGPPAPGNEEETNARSLSMGAGACLVA